MMFKLLEKINLRKYSLLKIIGINKIIEVRLNMKDVLIDVCRLNLLKI